MKINKYCKRCGLNKPIELFSCNRSKPDGLQSHCKACNKEMNQNWRDKNWEKYKAYVSKWNAENKDRVKAYRAEYSQRPIERYRQIQIRGWKRGVAVPITKEEFAKWFINEEWLCHYCGCKLNGYGNGDLCGLTIDRRDNHKSYELGNLVLSCNRCNIMKGSWLTEGQMLDAAKRYFPEPIIED